MPGACMCCAAPLPGAYIKSIDTSEAEKLDGVAAIITAENCPDVYYMQAGQGTPEPSPHDRRLFNRKVRHVGDRVAGIVARTAEIADKAAALIKVEYEPTGCGVHCGGGYGPGGTPGSQRPCAI